MTSALRAAPHPPLFKTTSHGFSPSYLAPMRTTSPYSALRRFAACLTLALAFALPPLAQAALAAPVAALQDATTDTQFDDAVDTDLGIGSFWELTEKAGGFRWAIFATLILGLLLIAYQLFVLFNDRSKGAHLRSLEVEHMSAEKIADEVQGESNHMLANIYATLLNVFSTQDSAMMLHDEIVNFADSEQDRFSTFQRRADFLSDTAGALGLLGTVWGIFAVFYGGSMSKEQILSGMGVALITTLMGLVVSIIINLCSTEVYAVFNRRLAEVSKNADVLRFRLLELSGEVGNLSTAAVAAPRAARQPAAAQPRRAPAPAAAATGATPSISISGAPKSPAAGSTIHVPVHLKSADGKPLSGKAVSARVASGGGSVKGANTDAKGVATLTWTLGAKAGRQVMQARAEGQDTSLAVDAAAGPPAKTQADGNNQSAKAGQTLTTPFALLVTDATGNPVEGVPVSFEVKQGDGRFDGQTKRTTQTDASGRAMGMFTLGKTPGFNVVEARAKGVGKAVTFQAMGSE